MSLGQDSLLEMLPEVAIRNHLPVGSFLLALALLAKNEQGLVMEDLTVCADVDRSIGSDSNDGSCQLSPSRASSVSSYGGVEHETIFVLSRVR